MGSNIEKEPWTNVKLQYKKWSKEIKSDNEYCKVGGAITLWGKKREKSKITIAIYEKLAIC